MDKTVEYIELAMIRNDLENLPVYSVPSGYRIRPFEPGDERHWAEIELRAGEFDSIDAALARFEHEFRANYDLMPERSFVLESEQDGPIGTTSAWFGTFQGRALGSIHFVAIVPEHHGRGLSKPLVATALHRLAQDHDAAYLTTQTWSWRAVGLYLKVGFEPVYDGDAAHRAMAIIEEKLAARR